MVERYEFGQGHVEDELSGRLVSLNSFSIRFSSGNPLYKCLFRRDVSIPGMVSFPDAVREL